MARCRRKGTSLVEVLVVIVIFSIGILAIVQIFPGGFQALAQTRNQSVATQLGRDEVERLKARPDLLPEQIVPVTYVFSAGDVQILSDASRRADDLGPAAQALDQNGQLLDTGGNPLGNWMYLSGANNSRRIIGEGDVVPAPRQVGNLYGGLRVLQFGPIVFNQQYRALFPVYGNDMTRRLGDPEGRMREWEFYVDEPETAGATLYIRQAANNRSYRLTMTAYVQTGGGVVQRDVVDAIVDVAAGGGVASFPVASFAGLTGGESFLGVEWESVRLARLFQRLPVGSSFDPTDPYQYMVLDEGAGNSSLGLLLFNPRGYNFTVRGPQGRRIPLLARVNYDVFDWRILRDNFRVPSSRPATQRLMVGGLKVLGNAVNADGTVYQGIGVQLPNATGNPENRDIAIVDTETGGVYLERTPGGQPLMQIDKSMGSVTFLDGDNDVNNGLQGMLMLPGANSPVTLPIQGRSVRALYQARNEWSLQVLKAPSIYRQAFNARPGLGQYYVGGSDANVGGSSTRVYFPWADVGRKVVLGEVWTVDSMGNQQGPNVVSEPIQGTPADPIGLPYIDVAAAIPGAVGFDARNGYSVRQVRGASVAVRVLWNTSTFTLRPDAAENLSAFERFGRNWRRATTETYLQRGDN